MELTERLLKELYPGALAMAPKHSQSQIIFRWIIPYSIYKHYQATSLVLLSTDQPSSFSWLE